VGHVPVVGAGHPVLAGCPPARGPQAVGDGVLITFGDDPTNVTPKRSRPSGEPSARRSCRTCTSRAPTQGCLCRIWLRVSVRFTTLSAHGGG
jgi:hypothetical protein